MGKSVSLLTMCAYCAAKQMSGKKSRNQHWQHSISQRKAPIMHNFESHRFKISIVIPNLRCGLLLGWGKVFIGSVKNLFQPNDLRQVGKLLFLVEIFVIGIDAQLIDW